MSQELSPHQEFSIDKEDNRLDLYRDDLTEVTASELSSQYSSVRDMYRDGDEDHENSSFSSSSLDHAYEVTSSPLSTATAPLAPHEGMEVRRTSSILKRAVSEEDMQYIKTTKRCWQCLPRPDIDEVVRKSATSGTANDECASSARSNSVCFGEIRIRSYAQTLGDNPSCSYGPPIQLDWDFEEHEALAVDDYEDGRAPRRTMRQMVLSYYYRKNLLTFYYGVSEDAFKACKRQIQREKLYRSVTSSSLPIMHVEAALESAARKAKRFFGKKPKKN